MQKETGKGKQITRRGLLPILGSSLLIPFLGFSITETNEEIPLKGKEEEYQILLKKDGTTVKVKMSTINKSKVVKQNISNSSFFSWLGKKK